MTKRHATRKERQTEKRSRRRNDPTSGTDRSPFRRAAIWGSALSLLAAALIGIVFFASRVPKDERTGVASPATMTEEDWIKGSAGSGVLLVEYSDFQCPACASYYPVVKRLSQRFGDRLAVVYRHFPLKQIHRNAELAARAAEAAGSAGKFWEMHDLLFEEQGRWAKQSDPMETFLGYAKQLGLDAEGFQKNLRSSEVKKAVEEDRRSGFNAGVNSTPTFFLNGKKMTNPRSEHAFERLLQKAVDAAS